MFNIIKRNFVKITARVSLSLIHAHKTGL